MAAMAPSTARRRDAHLQNRALGGRRGVGVAAAGAGECGVEAALRREGLAAEEGEVLQKVRRALRNQSSFRPCQAPATAAEEDEVVQKVRRALKRHSEALGFGAALAGPSGSCGALHPCAVTATHKRWQLPATDGLEPRQEQSDGERRT